MMMDMSGMGTGAMVAMGIYHLAIFIFAVLGTVAAIKYLRTRWFPAGEQLGLVTWQNRREKCTHRTNCSMGQRSGRLGIGNRGL